MKNKKLYISLGIVALAVGLVAISYWFVSMNAPDVVNVTNVTSSSATISWTSEDPEPGLVIAKEGKYSFPIVPASSRTQLYYDDRDVSAWELENADADLAAKGLPKLETDQINNYYTHHVTVMGLDPDTKYSFMVGTGKFFYRVGTHDGETYFSTAVEVDEVTTPDPAYGKVKVPVGDSPTNSVLLTDGTLYMYIENSFGEVLSNRVSATLNNEGSWYLDLNTLYNSDGKPFYTAVPESEVTLYKQVLEVYTPDGEIYQKKISPADDTPADDMFLLDEYRVERAITGQPPLSGLASSAYAWDLTCPNGKKLHADAADQGSFVGVYGAQAEQKWREEASGYCNDPGTPSWVEGQPTVELTSETCPVTWTEVGAFGSNDGCTYTCVGMGRKSTTGVCKNEWGNGSYCQKQDPSCGQVCVGGEVCRQGDFCVDGNYQCCQTGCNVRASEGGSSGSGSGSGTGSGSGSVDPGKCPIQKPSNATERCGDDNDCEEVGQWCGDLNSEPCKCGKGTVECGRQCTQPIFDGQKADKICCTIFNTAIILDTYDGKCPSGFSTGDPNSNMCKAAGGTTSGGTSGGTSNPPVCCLISGTGTPRWMTTTNGQCPPSSTESRSCGAPPAQVNLPATPPPAVSGGNAPGSTCAVEPGKSCGKCSGQLGQVNGVEYLCTDYGFWNVLMKWRPVITAGESCPVDSGCICATESRGSIVIVEGSKCEANYSYYASSALKPIGIGQQCPTNTNGCFCNESGKVISVGNYCGQVAQCTSGNVGRVCNSSGNTCEQSSDSVAYYIDQTGKTVSAKQSECQSIPYCNGTSGHPVQVDAAIYSCTGGSIVSMYYREASMELVGNQVLGADTAKTVVVSPVENAVAVEEDGIYCTALDNESYCFVMGGGIRNTLYVDTNGNNQYDEGTDMLVSQDGQELQLQQEASTFEYQLSKGFNFVSFTFVNNAYMGTASDLLAYLNSEYSNAFYSIAKFESGRWRIVGNREGEGYGSENFPIVPGEGYLLKTNADLVITLSGQRITQAVPVHVAAGWNLIGINTGSEATGYTAESLIDDINSTEGLTAVNVSRWATEKAKYEGLQKETVDGTAQVYGFDFPISSRNSYFLRIVEGDTTWTPTAR